MAEQERIPERTLPRDEFSVAMRGLGNNPGAVRKESIVNITDDYGNLVTWVVTSFRADGFDTVLLQRQAPDGAIRLVLPPAVMAAIGRQQAGATTANRKRGARQAAETRKLKGIEPAFVTDPSLRGRGRRRARKRQGTR
jgi:hypothetical protein